MTKRNARRLIWTFAVLGAIAAVIYTSVVPQTVNFEPCLVSAEEVR